MSAISQNNTSKTAEFYIEHHGWLQRWLAHRLNCHVDAEDLAHDTFIRVMRSRHQTKDIRKPRQFLITVAKGLSIDLYRRRTIERQYLEALKALPEPQWPSEEAQAITLEILTELDEMLSGLGSNVRETFLLSQCEGLSYEQIAKTLNISRRSVSNHMAKAMEHCCLFRLEKHLK
ncbi:MAG: sigma-70 family RNA polymerase sigma factor [Pseudomonadota bacterium]